MSLRKPNGQLYEPDTLTSFHRAIARYFKDYVDIVRDHRFRTSRDILSTKRLEAKEVCSNNCCFEGILWTKMFCGYFQGTKMFFYELHKIKVILNWLVTVMCGESGVLV